MSSNVITLQQAPQPMPPPYASPGYYGSCGCGCPPPCPPFCNYPAPVQPIPPMPPPAPIQAAIIGVTDGSDAAPGIVGEFIRGSTIFSYAASPQMTTVSLSVLVVQPGDWNLWAYIWGMGTNFGGAKFDLSPVPTGMSNSMGTINGIGALVPLQQQATVISALARGSFTVPTLLAFSVTIDQSNTTGLAAGLGNLAVEGRRMR